MSKANTASIEPTRASQVRRRIHTAVIKCVERWGIEKTSLSDIAKEAGCTRQTVYNYFPGKAEVLASALDEAGQEFKARVEDHARQFDDPAESLLEAMVFTIRMLPREPYLHVLTEPTFLVTFLREYFDSRLSRERIQATIRVCLRNAPELLPHVAEISEVSSRFIVSMLMSSPGVKRSEKQLRDFIRRRILPGLLQP